MVVKVQISQFSSGGTTRMLIYNKKRTVEYEDEAPPELIKIMAGEPKKFFHAEMVPDDRPGVKGQLIQFGDPAPWQEW